MNDDNGVTLGEVGRNVERLTAEVSGLAKQVGELAVADARQGEKVDRLEKVVYGALGVAGASLLTAVVTAVVSVSR